MNPIDCSIVIVNWNVSAYLIECIQSIKKFTTCTYEIIVIDNDSLPEEKEKLLTIQNIKIIFNNKNVGFAAANNRGIKEAIGRCVLLLNPDTKLVNNAIDKMVSFLEANNTFSAIGPKLYYSDKYDYHPSIKSLDSPLYNLFFLIPGSLYFKKVYQYFVYKLDKIQKVNCLTGAAILFNKEVFDEIGILDEQFFIYSEEVDLFMRMKRCGLKSIYYPRAEVIHYGGKSQQKSPIQGSLYLWSSKIKYFKKHFSKLNVMINLLFIYVLIKIKVEMFQKKELAPICELIKRNLRLS